MDGKSPQAGWLLLLAQLPSTPSSARVSLWRRMRGLGATALVNGAWALPHTASHEKALEKLEATIHKQNGTAFVLAVRSSSPAAHEAVVERFQADRAREYDEFAERCDAFSGELAKETTAEKYTFAEMEEAEQELEKLSRWLSKIHARDFFPGERRRQSDELLNRCRDGLADFSQAVYAAEGVEKPAKPDSPA
jgi:hypothetical protein